MANFVPGEPIPGPQPSPAVDTAPNVIYQCSVTFTQDPVSPQEAP